ncbi:MAG: (d)CMP kinase [Gammaproteobacteria bacterium]|nr:MAG: (d)CMP kinase [Gammaproteobacteria bacterium]
MTKEIPVITIDGPSGAGKGSVAAIIAEKLGWNLLDSGAIYRLLALSAIKKNIDFENSELLTEEAKRLNVEFIPQKGSEIRILLDGEDVTGEIRTEKCGNTASKIAAILPVRDALLQRQRDFAKEPGLVADGRDMGTVVFSSAAAKIFLTASAEERAKRRYKQLKQKEFNVNLAALVKEIEERDLRDTTRKVAPLKPAEDAIVIDSSNLDIDQVVQQIMQHIDLV